MRTHKLKCWPSAFEAIERGDKTFEYRKNDRDFAVDDVLELQLWDPYASYAGVGHGAFVNRGGYAVSHPKDAAVICARVTYMLQGRFGVPENYCVMSIVKLGGDDHA